MTTHIVLYIHKGSSNLFSMHGYIGTSLEGEKFTKNIYDDKITTLGYVKNKSPLLLEDRVKPISVLNYIDALNDTDTRYNEKEEVEKVLQSVMEKLISSGHTVNNPSIIIYSERAHNKYTTIKINGKEVTLITVEPSFLICLSGQKIVEELYNLNGFIRKNEPDGIKSSEIRYSNPDSYWEVDITKNPLISFNRLIFNTCNYLNETGVYLSAHLKKIKESNFIGKKSANLGYGYIQSRVPDPIFELIKTMSPHKDSTINNLAVCRLDRIFSKYVVRNLLEYGVSCFKRNYRERTFDYIDGEPIVDIIDPPLLSYQVIDIMEELKNIWVLFNERVITKVVPSTFKSLSLPGEKEIFSFTVLKQEFIYKDLTDLFFEQNAKGKNLLKKEYGVGCNDLIIRDTIIMDDQEYILPYNIYWDLNIPSRNSLSRLTENNPKVYLLLLKLDDNVYKHYTVVTSDVGEGVYCNYESSIIFLKAKKKKNVKHT